MLRRNDLTCFARKLVFLNDWLLQNLDNVKNWDSGLGSSYMKQEREERDLDGLTDGVRGVQIIGFGHVRRC